MFKEKDNDVGIQDRLPEQRSFYSKSNPNVDLLEPRILLDAAAVVAGAEVLDDPNPAEAAKTEPSSDTPSDYPDSDDTDLAAALDDAIAPAITTLSDDPTIELVFVDTQIQNYESLLYDLFEVNLSDTTATVVDDTEHYTVSQAGRTLNIVLLDTSTSAINQMTDVVDTVSADSAIDGIHILSHGSAGELRLGGELINDNTLADYATELTSWQTVLTEDADILLYGCNVAADEAGIDFIHSLSELTGADVAASIDETGSTDKGGDYDLEVHTGTIETEALAPSSDVDGQWSGLLAPPLPDVSLSVPGSNLLNETFTFSATFTSSGDPGYAPFMDLIVESGVQLNSASIFSAGDVSLANAFTWNGSAWEDSGGNVLTEHPYGSGIPLPGAPTDEDSTWYVIDLPYGSFTASQDATITFDALLVPAASLATGPGAVVGQTDQTAINARAGFRFGADEFDNPIADPPIVSAFDSETIEPIIAQLSKSHDAAEDETATGEDFPVTYTLTVNVADIGGGTINDIVENIIVEDFLPNNVVFVEDSLTVMVNGASVLFSANTDASLDPGEYEVPTSGTPTNNATIRVNIGDVVGTASAGEIVINYMVYGAENSADPGNPFVISPDNSDPAENIATVSGSYDQHNDGTAEIEFDGDLDDDKMIDDPDSSPYVANDELELHALALQKGAQAVADNNLTSLDTGVGTASVSPDPNIEINNTSVDAIVAGTVIQWDLDFQVSSYYAFDAVAINDTLSDGQAFIPTADTSGGVDTVVTTAPAPSYSITIPGMGTYEGTFDPANFTVARNAVNGQTSILLDISAQLLAAHSVTELDSATTGSIRYFSVIEENYQDTGFDTNLGDVSVDWADFISNDAVISGTVTQGEINDPGGTFDGTLEEETTASITLSDMQIDKSVFAINGIAPAGPNPEIQAGDLITYAVELTLPSGDFEDFSVTDFLPLPVYDVSTLTTVTVTTTDATPSEGEITYADSNRITDGITTVNPTVSVDTAANSFTLDFGDNDFNNSEPFTITLLYTLAVQDKAFADSVVLTNEVVARRGNSFSASLPDLDDVEQVTLRIPELTITKGIVSFDSNVTDGGGPSFTETPVGPIAFSDPGINPPFTPPITSAGLLIDPVDSNLLDVDAGDTVKHAIVVENTGGGDAFDIAISDQLPTEGYVTPSIGSLGALVPAINLQVFDGSGMEFTYDDTPPLAANTYQITAYNAAAGTFSIEINDDPNAPGQPIGALGNEAEDGATGKNVLIITYDLVVADTAVPLSTYVNTATLSNYAGQEGGIDHTAEDLSDDASITTNSLNIDKIITATNALHTDNRDVAIGEIVTYQVTIDIPEGETPDLILNDTLDRGLALVDITSIENPDGTLRDASDNLLDAAYFNSVIAAADVSPSSSAVNSGTQLELDFGTIKNTAGSIDNDNTTTEQLVITYRAVVLNVDRNDAGDNRNNIAGVTWTVDSGDSKPVTDSAPNVNIVEPVLTLDKSADVTSADANDTINYTFVITNDGSANEPADAFDLVFSDPLDPDGDIFIASPAIDITITAPGYTTVGNSSTANNVSLTFDELRVGDSITIEVKATVVGNTQLDVGFIDNEAEVTYTSLPGDVTTSQTTYNDYGVERTGDTNPTDGTETSPTDVESANDYVARDDVRIKVGAEIEKTIVSTSEIHTDDSDVAIGEIVRYRLEVQVPESNLFSIMIDDTLDDGLLYLDSDDSTKISIIADNLFTKDMNLSGADNDADPPTFVLPPAFINYDLGSNTVTFDLGNMVNNDNDSGAEYIIIEYNALVLNTLDNQAGEALANSALVTINEIEQALGTVTVDVVEPDITLTKTITTTPQDAGDTIIYEYQITNNGSADAFDLNFIDPLPLEIELIDAMVSSAGDAMTTGIEIDASSFATLFTGSTGTTTGNITLAFERLNVGETITITAQGTVSDTVAAAKDINNTATVNYTSLPDEGTAPGVDNPTGSQTPGASGDDDGERNGDDGIAGLNNYVVSANASVEINAPTVVKQLTDTSIENYTIGDLIEYDLIVTVPEGTTQNLIITDNVPVGMNYESAQLITTAAAANNPLTMPMDFSGVIPPTLFPPSLGNGVDVIFNLGNVTNAPDANNAGINNDTFIIRVTLLLRDEITNIGTQDGPQTTLTNIAGGTFQDPDEPQPEALDNSEEDITVIEPVLDITKTASDMSPGFGDTVTFVLVIDHENTTNISTADAFDISITDTIPSGLTFVPGSILVNAMVTPDPVPNPSMSGTLTLDLGDLPLGDDIIVIYQAEVSDPNEVSLGDDLTNEVDLNWDNQDGEPQSGVDRDGVDSADETVTVTGPDLAITKDSPTVGFSGEGLPPVEAGGSNYTYTLTVINNGNGEATGVTVVDTLPPGVNFISVAEPGVTTMVVDQTITFSGAAIDTLAAGEQFTLTVTVSPPDIAAFDQEELENTATVNHDDIDPTDEDNTDTETDPLLASPDYAIQKTNNNTDSLVPGQMTTYTLTVSNNGNQDGSNVVITDTFDADVLDIQLGDITVPPGVSVVLNPGVITFTVTDNALVAAENAFDIQIQATVQDPYPITPDPEVVLNTVEVMGDGEDPDDLDDNTDDDEDPVDTLIDLELSKTVSTATAIYGDIITYTITVLNNDDNANTGATDVEVTDVLPAGLNLVTSNATSGSYNAGTNTWSLVDPLLVGQQVTLTITAEVTDAIPIGDFVVNTAEVTFVGGDDVDFDSTPGNNILSEDDQDQAIFRVVGDILPDDDPPPPPVVIDPEGPPLHDRIIKADIQPVPDTSADLPPYVEEIDEETFDPKADFYSTYQQTSAKGYSADEIAAMDKANADAIAKAEAAKATQAQAPIEASGEADGEDVAAKEKAATFDEAVALSKARIEKTEHDLLSAAQAHTQTKADIVLSTKDIPVGEH